MRIGTAAITTRGMKEEQMELIVDCIDSVLMNMENETEISSVHTKVKQLANEFPLYGENGKSKVAGF